MLRRKREGSVVCPSCGTLVGVNDDRCYNCGRARPGLWGFTPLLRLGHDFGFGALVIAGSILLYLAALLLSMGGPRAGGIFGALSPNGRSLFLLGASGALPVFGLGRWWTLLSAAWLHGSPLHILFNMLWVRQLSPATADAFGAARMVLIYTVSSITGFGLSSVVGAFLPFLPRFLGGAQFTVGASAPVFGLLGALVLYGQRRGSSALGSQALSYAVILGIFGFIMPGIDNWAHLGGFAGGWLTAHVLDPWKEEKVDHVILAFLCLGATAAAIAASILTGLPQIR